MYNRTHTWRCPLEVQELIPFEEGISIGIKILKKLPIA